MNSILDSALLNVQQAEAAWCRFITGNDTGSTGSHQAGFYVPKCAASLMFDKPGVKGENKEKLVTIKWQDNFITESCMKYYGQGTRNEYRITRFGRNFPFLEDDNIGDLLIIAKCTDTEYLGYVLSSDEDIDAFFAYFNLSPGDTNHLINLSGVYGSSDTLSVLFDDFISKHEDFPETREMASGARECYNKAFHVTNEHLKKTPDAILMKWIDTEYKLFRSMEDKFYAEILSKPFKTVESFVQTANEVLNRRKSRAGKSLEHHLSDIFTSNNLHFEAQAVTEDNKRPDFIFPDGSSYHNLLFPTENLTILGVKTTCKDRWRQVLTEADRIEEKHLFTLQQGISRNQLKEMQDSKLHLVVPRQNIPCFPMEYQSSLLDLSQFISIIKNKQHA
ncbi:MAG: restriction endonuclease [Bacteroidetes bacterium]|uniref:Restriction endonuclease n=1 Tax=Candidatus Cryptobacteroides avistercoris TaxID=2840758 RepID=A0A9D9IWV3_9BACT|nr:restriction endonuclease [Candidatus Cryptobacteroides avistercoris]